MLNAQSIIETNRLVLRELSLHDADYFYTLNLDEEVLKYTGDLPFENKESAQRFLINYNHYQKYGFGRWAVIRKSDNQFLGWCGLKFTKDKNEVDIGFRFFKKYWNKGYATESAKACVEYGFNTLNVTEIVGRAMIANSASIRVLENIGLKFKCDFDFDGNKGVIYSLKNTSN